MTNSGDGAILVSGLSPKDPCMDTPNPTPGEPDQAGLRNQTAMSADGVAISYDVVGDGKPSLVFVHGMACNRTFWDAQVNHFASRYQVVAIDLAGHGESGTDRCGWTIRAFSDDVIAVVCDLDIKDVVFVGHSLGALVVLEAAQRLEDRTAAVVLVDEISDVKDCYSKLETTLGPIILKARYRWAMGQLIRRTMFTRQANPQLIEQITTSMLETRPEVVVSLLGQNGGYIDFYNNHKLEALKAISSPLVLVNPSKANTPVEANRVHLPSLIVEEIPDTGHFLMIEQPTALNKAITRAIELC